MPHHCFVISCWQCCRSTLCTLFTCNIRARLQVSLHISPSSVHITAWIGTGGEGELAGGNVILQV